MSKEDFINAMVLDAERGFYHAEEETQYEFQKEWEKEQNLQSLHLTCFLYTETPRRVRVKGKLCFVLT